MAIPAARAAGPGSGARALEHLTATARAVTVGGVLLLGAAAALAGAALSSRDGLAFTACALPVWLWLGFRLRRGLHDNVLLARPHELRPTLGAPTAVTLARGLLIGAVAGFAPLAPVAPVSWLPGPLYAIAALLDVCDGALARRTGRTTRLGARLDVSTDAAGLLAAPIVAVAWGRLPPWYLLLAFAYPLFRAGLGLRVRLGLPVFPERLRPDPRARLAAALQMALVAAALFPVLPRAFLWPAATVAMLPTLLLFAGEWRTATRQAGRKLEVRS